MKMKKLIGRCLISRVSDAASASSSSSSSSSSQQMMMMKEVVTCTPQGHVPVYVGDERFAIRAELLGRPVFAELLRLSAEEYGYEQKGVLRIPCSVPHFRRLLLAASSS